MRSTSPGEPTLNGEGAAFRKATPSELRLATQDKISADGARTQADGEARRCEGLARNCALAALGLRGSLAFQQASLSRHYAARSVALATGVVR